MKRQLLVAVALTGALSTAVAQTWDGELTTVWPNFGALCVELPEERSRHVSQLCFGLLGLKWQIGTFGDSPMSINAMKWDLQPLVFLRDDDNAGQGRPIGAFSPDVQAAFKEISLTGIDLAVNVLPNGGAAAVGFGLLPHEGNLREAGAHYPKNAPSAYSWDDFFVTMPEGDACAYSKDAAGDPVYLAENVGRSVMKDGFKLANLSACGASFSGLGSLNTALKKSCEAWASDTNQQECHVKQKAKSAPEKTDNKDTSQKSAAAAEASKSKPKPEAAKPKPKKVAEPKVTELDNLLAEIDAPDKDGPSKGGSASTFLDMAELEPDNSTTGVTSVQAKSIDPSVPITIPGEWNMGGRVVILSDDGTASYPGAPNTINTRTFEHTNPPINHGIWEQTGPKSFRVALTYSSVSPSSLASWEKFAESIDVDLTGPNEGAFTWFDHAFEYSTGKLVQYNNDAGDVRRVGVEKQPAEEEFSIVGEWRIYNPVTGELVNYEGYEFKEDGSIIALWRETILGSREEEDHRDVGVWEQTEAGTYFISYVMNWVRGSPSKREKELKLISANRLGWGDAYYERLNPIPEALPLQTEAEQSVATDNVVNADVDNLLTELEASSSNNSKTSGTTSASNLDTLLLEVDSGDGGTAIDLRASEIDAPTEPQASTTARANQNCGEDFYASPEYGSCVRQSYNKEIDAKQYHACLDQARAAVKSRNESSCGKREAPDGPSALQQ